MVDLTNPLGGLVPAQQGPEVIPNPSPEQQSDIAGQWKNWMANEGNRAALMQFGIAMMQPVGLGQTPLGHVGQAIGSVGELGTRREEAERKERELSSKEELRGAQAQVAEARAGAAGAGAGAAATRAAHQRDVLEFQRQRYGTQALIGLQRQHGLEMDRRHKANESARLTNPNAPPLPIQNFNDWLATNPQLGASLAVHGVNPPSATPPTPTGEEGEPSTTPPPAAGAGSGVPPPAQRVVGQTYQTPRGPMVWERGGWRAP